MTPFTLLVPPAGGYISRVSSRQTRNFGFGQSSQSHLRLRHRPPNTAGALHAWVVSGGPGQALSSLPLSLLRSKARGSPSVASPFSGAKVRRTFAFNRFTPSAPVPAQLRFLRFTVLHRSKVRGSPSVANPLAGAGIHWIPAFYPARPSALGSAKGAQKSKKYSADPLPRGSGRA